MPDAGHQFFAHEDAGEMLVAVLALTFIAGVVLGAIGLFAYAMSWTPLYGIVAAGAVVYLLEVIGGCREYISGGLFADDQQVGLTVSDSFARLRRKAYDRKQLHEVQITPTGLAVFGPDGSKLFASGAFSSVDMERFAAFVDVHTVRETPGPGPALAVPPVETPEGVLPLPVRRAAGLLLTVGGIVLFLALANMIIRLPFLPPGQLAKGVGILGGLAVFGGLYITFGFLLARGRRRSRELALYGGPVATLGLFADILIASRFPPAAIAFGILFGAIDAVVAYWLRKPLPAR